MANTKSPSSFLCLDLGTTTGFAYVNTKTKIVLSGILKNYKKTKDRPEEKFSVFYDNLERLFWAVDTRIDEIYYELPNFASFKNQNITFNGLLGVLFCLGVKHSIDHYKTIAPSTLKKTITGNGMAKKEEVMEKCLELFPLLQLTDHNQADALAIAYYVNPNITKFKKRYKIVTASSDGGSD